MFSVLCVWLGKVMWKRCSLFCVCVLCSVHFAGQGDVEDLFSVLFLAGHGDVEDLFSVLCVFSVCFGWAR